MIAPEPLHIVAGGYLGRILNERHDGDVVMIANDAEGNNVTLFTVAKEMLFDPCTENVYAPDDVNAPKGCLRAVVLYPR